MSSEISFDEPRCEGFGFCEEVAPEFFEIDDSGVLTVLRKDVPVDLEKKVQAAVRACPVAALRLGVTP
ncbi:hypothetical protein GCM10023147_42730 [Tsukamurella soli]|uniref:Ferredoxin n=1 Tax=Tsukamurella soli TaxID=644556 RepID=A0ABP8KA52_9ACTN